MVPTTMIGRIIGMICCILGIFLLSLNTVTLMLYLTLDDELKIKHIIISNFQTKGSENNYFNNYFETFLKYKMNRVRKSKYITNQVKNYFILKNRFKIEVKNII